MPFKTFIPQASVRIRAGRSFRFVNILIFTLFAISCTNKPLTEQDAKAVRAQLDRSIEQRDPSFLRDFLDGDELADRVIAHMPSTPDRATKAGIRKSATGATFASQIMEEIRKGSSYRFVKSYSDGRAEHLVYRLYGDQGMNYHDWELTGSGSKVKAADLMIYFTGETMSQTLAGLLAGVESKNVRPELAAEMKEVRRLMNRGEIAEARALHDGWPESFRSLKLIQLVNIQLLSASGDNVSYVAALEKFEGDFPEATNAPLLMIDAYLLNGAYPKAMAAVNKLDSFLKGDPFLDYYRGLVSKMAEDTAAYHSYIARAYKTCPDLEDVVIEMLYVYHQQGDIAGERAVENAYRANPGFSVGKLNAVKTMMASEAG